MKKKVEKVILAYLKDYRIEDIVKTHCRILPDGAPKPSKTILYQKYQYMLHLIITHCKFSRLNSFSMNTKFYRDFIFHDHYQDMHATLGCMGIITHGPYEVGKHSTRIELRSWNIGYMTSYNENYIKWSEICQNRRWEERPVEETPFVRQYTESLSCLKLVRKEDALAKVENEIEDKQTHKYHYHISSIEYFNEENLRIYNIDKQDRIYHVLTSLPRSLREFFNIKYEMDIGNSHPLLLNYYLCKRYSISKEMLINAKAQYHYDVEDFSNIITFNDLAIPEDVMAYICKTQSGTFYEDFCAEFGDMDRSEVKKKVFSQVFYSHLQYREKFVSKFCAAFKSRYPNVYKVLCTMKIKTDDKLPHLMMKIESFLFRKILQECWNRGYKVVNLHDALVLFDVEENLNVSFAELEGIIQQVYNRYNLFPTVKVEIGG